MKVIVALPVGLFCFIAACSSEAVKEDWPPDQLPFEFTRPENGQPLTREEIVAFTKKITGFWKQTDYFGWALWHAHGLHASYDKNMPEYGLWWQDTIVRKSGDTVTFVHVGGADNLEIRTSKMLSQAMSGYLASGDPRLGKLARLYAAGIVALFQGMLWGPNDPDKYITARAIFTHNHNYIDDAGRKVAVDYDPVKQEKYDWNAHTVPNPQNPIFGSIWVRNMRSKDDLPHIFRMAYLMARAERDAKDPQVRAAASQAWEYLKGFACDIVQSGYKIRSKENGQVFIPTEDLASFVDYEAVIPNAECNPKLTAAIVCYGSPLENDCEKGLSPTYEQIATGTHYYNYAIVRYFHLTALVHALMAGKNLVARTLLEGLVERVETMLADEAERAKYPEWDADAASFLLAAAACGLPLTAQEARLIKDRYERAVDFYSNWPYWNIYDSSLPDGDYPLDPGRDDTDTKHVHIAEMGYLVEYCYSPFRNPAGAELIDCEVVLDPTKWGQ